MSTYATEKENNSRETTGNDANFPGNEGNMPDNVNLLKVIAVFAAGAISVSAASRFTEDYVAEAAFKDKTLAEAVMQSQLQAELKKAEEQAAKELEEQGQTLVTTVLETKPPVTEPPLEITEPPDISMEIENTVTETEITEISEIFSEITETTAETTTFETESTEPAEEEIITEFTRGGLLPTDRTGLPVRSMFTLTAEQQTTITYFLIDHYFLDGYKYSKEESRPELKEKKQLAAEMESGVIETLNMVLGNMNMSDITSMLSADYGAMADQVREIRADFEGSYKDAYIYGEHFADLYDNSLKYFDRLIKALENVGDTARQYREATNPLLAIGLLTSSIDNVIIPEIMAVLEQSFDLVEASQEIFLEGTTGTKLLTRQEVTDIILNPALVLDTNIAER
ncbi:MAG: hypothetical protein J1E40_13180 [Oscillospiraceae bacterium]|nr:hypothetical protein [Oscillospiraceae bacterium]